MADSYYQLETPRLLQNFDRIVESAYDVFLDRFQEDELSVIQESVRKKFEELIPEIPYIGGKDNPFSEDLENSAISLALYIVLKEKGMSIEEIGKLNYDVVNAFYRKTPGYLLWIMRRFIFSRFSKNSLKKNAMRSQVSAYPDDFLVEYIEGTGEDFDIGLDYTRCTICSFYDQQGALEFAKYVCLADYVVSEMMNSGLVRTTTIAEGADRCDFRFKKGRSLRPDWPPKFSDEF